MVQQKTARRVTGTTCRAEVVVNRNGNFLPFQGLYG